ncbi:ABC transporter permease [Vallicoccus soli]|uniref:ABC transporter permease n=1 Tax=Vallicoccus soli TaxID=2339232 RepID=A0A3A3ZK55_9ACTN|nr:ABC transporter permease [Vallicoccus soli]RJK96089.1 ABC transporter permease [Vallicoccus soli]
MTAQAVEPLPGGAAPGRPDGAGGPQGRARRALRYAGLPVVLLLVLAAVWVWIATADLDSIEERLLEPAVLREQLARHLELVGVSTVLVVAVALPLGVLATRPAARRVAPLVVGFANAAQTVPSFGVLVLIAVALGQIGFWPSIAALVLYAFLPVLRNTMVGLTQVDPAVVESARGMGMSPLTVLRRIELPLAVPVIIAGIRTAAVINVGTATIAALVNAGGLGQTIYQGLTLGRASAQVVGAVLAGVLALLVDHVLDVTEELVRPRGL